MELRLITIHMTKRLPERMSEREFKVTTAELKMFMEAIMAFDRPYHVTIKTRRDEYFYMTVQIPGGMEEVLSADMEHAQKMAEIFFGKQ